MYYLKIQDEEGIIGDTLIYYCRNCGHEDTTLNTANICVSDMQLRSSEKKYTHIVNEYTKFDPTLPRINTIKCPNQECSSNVMNGGIMNGGIMNGGAPGEKKPTTVKKTAAEKKITIGKKSTKALAEETAKAAALAELEEAEAQASAAASAEASAAAAAATLAPGEQENNREVIYIRYDDTNMKYVYLCVHCDTTWRTDNRL